MPLDRSDEHKDEKTDRRPDDITAWWNVVDWDHVAGRFGRARG